MKKHLFALTSKPSVKVQRVVENIRSEIELLSDPMLSIQEFNTIWNQEFVFTSLENAEKAKKLIYNRFNNFYESFTIELIESK